MKPRSLLDKQAIAEALNAYCRAVDRIDFERSYAVFHDGDEVDQAARGLIDFILTSHLQAIVHSHQISNILIKPDGDAARSEAYITSAMPHDA